MIPGRNVDVEHEGRKYQIQVEDQGEESWSFEVRLTEGGSILWQKEFPYPDGLEGVDDATRYREMLALVDKTVQTVKAALLRGKLP